MPAPLKVDRNAVRVLASAVGLREAARQTGIPENTVLAWSAREGWKEDEEKAREIAAARVQEREKGLGIVQSSAIKSPAECMADTLADHNKRTRINLAKAALRLSENAENVELDQAGDVLQVGKLAALVHGWAQSGDGQQTLININLLGAELPQAKVIEIE
jgi:hypothetical protein